MRPAQKFEDQYDDQARIEERIYALMKQAKKWPVSMAGMPNLYRLALKDVHKRMRFLDVRLAEYLGEDAWCEKEWRGKV